MNKVLIVIAGLLISVIGFSQTQNIIVNGTSREMIVHIPPGLTTGRPLVISLHGMNQSASYQQTNTSWDAVSDTANFVVVYPNGINSAWDINGTSDLNFIEAIIDAMYTDHSIDKNRVYLTGFSMGGMMTYHAANNIADKIAAFGPVSGYMSTVFNSSRPIPLIHTHGTADDVVPYLPGPSGATGADFPGIYSIVEGWASRDNCNATPVTTSPYPSTGSVNTKQIWTNGDCGTEVVLISLDGKGHWHSDDINAVHTTSEIWRFVSRYTLDCGTASLNVSFTSPTVLTYVAPATITFDVLVEDSDGELSNINFYVNGDATAVHEEWLAPFAWDMEFTEPGTYQMEAVAYGVNNNTANDIITIKVNVPQAPFGGTAQQIPGKIEFEDFDNGGNGYAYYDTSLGNDATGDYRPNEDVDIEACEEGGYNIGWSISGEWLEYTVNVKETGSYNIVLRASTDGDKTLSISSDGVDIATDVLIEDTQGWQNWTDVVIENVELTAGEQVLRVTIGDNDYINLNYMSFELQTTPLVIHLKKGWNLIGYPYLEEILIEDALLDIWDNVEVVKDFNGFCENPDNLNSISHFNYGKGYMILVNNDCEFVW